MHKRLKIVSYDDYNNFERIYEERYNSSSAYVTDLSMYPFSQKTETRVTGRLYNIFYVAIPDMLPLIENILLNSQKLEVLSGVLPLVARNKLIMTQLVEEIQSTNDIEGVKSTRKEISEALHSNMGSNLRFTGIVNMYKAVMDMEKNQIKELKDFRDIYDQLDLSEIDEELKPDGELFRKDIVYVSSGHAKFHQGEPNEQQINEKLLKLIAFMNLSDNSFIFKAIITHYYFEYIHPFYDGNGRMGRFLISMYLGRKLDVFTGLSVSQGVLDNKKKYEKAFIEMSHPKNNGEITHFIIDMMKIIIDGQDKVREQMTLQLKQLHTAETYIERREWDENKASIMFLYFQNYLFEVGEQSLANKEIYDVYNLNKLSRRKIDAITEELESEGYLVTVKKRPKIYSLSEKTIRVVE